jgi:hypothetical protein
MDVQYELIVQVHSVPMSAVFLIGLKSSVRNLIIQSFKSNLIYSLFKVKKSVLSQQLALLMRHQLLLMLMYLNVIGKVMTLKVLVLMKHMKVVLTLRNNLSHVLRLLISYSVVVVDFFIQRQNLILKIRHYLVIVQIIDHSLMNIGEDILFGIRLI